MRFEGRPVRIKGILKLLGSFGHVHEREDAEIQSTYDPIDGSELDRSVDWDLGEKCENRIIRLRQGIFPGYSANLLEKGGRPAGYE